MFLSHFCSLFRYVVVSAVTTEHMFRCALAARELLHTVKLLEVRARVRVRVRVTQLYPPARAVEL